MLPTKIGLNSWLISIKRTNAIKAYEAMQKEEGSKKEQLTKHYDDTYSLYLEAIDKYQSLVDELKTNQDNLDFYQYRLQELKGLHLQSDEVKNLEQFQEVAR